MSFLIDMEVSAGCNIAQKIMKIYKLIEILKLNYKNVAQICDVLRKCQWRWRRRRKNKQK